MHSLLLRLEIDILFVIVSFVTAEMEKNILDTNVFVNQKKLIK